MPEPRGAKAPEGTAAGARAYEKVWAVVAAIPRGKVLSYGDVALLAGYPRGARFVAGALRWTGPTRVPWHRVVGRGGEVRIGEPELRKEQIRRLRSEGVAVDAEGRFAYDAYAWRGPQVHRPRSRDRPRT